MDTQDKFFFLKSYLYSRRFFLALLILLLGFILLFAFVFDTYRSLLEYVALLLAFLSFLFIGADAWTAFKGYRSQKLQVAAQAQTPLVAGMVAASMAVVHPMIGNVRIKFKEMSRFRYEK